LKIHIKNGHVIDGKSNLSEVCDILIEDGIIQEIGKIDLAEDVKILDATGQYVFPGLVDAHCHLRDPGFEYKEDIRSGTISAAMGGFTSVACMPNTNPVMDNKTVVSYIVNKAKDVGVVNVYPIGAVSKGQKGEELAPMGEMREYGIVAVSDDGMPVLNSDLMKKAMQYANTFGMIVISHSEDASLSGDGVMNEGAISTQLGLKGIPSIAEDIMVAREILLAEYLDLPVHIAHVSTKGSVEMIRTAKKRGVKVTCETCPQYFTLTEEACLGFNTFAKAYPPLRKKEDVLGVMEGLSDGTIDIIATDHAPHHEDEKNVEFSAAAKGMLGFETALGLCVTYLVKKGILTMEDLVKKCCYMPAKILGIPRGTIEKGGFADLVVVDVDHEYRVDRRALASKSKNSPFDGFALFGKAIHTIVNGKLVVQDGKFVG
jgi:dihydroorotase